MTKETMLSRMFGDWRFYWALASYPVVLVLIPICFLIHCAITAWHVSAYLQNSAEDLADEYKTWKTKVKVDE